MEIFFSVIIIVVCLVCMERGYRKNACDDHKMRGERV